VGAAPHKFDYLLSLSSQFLKAKEGLGDENLIDLINYQSFEARRDG